MIIFIKKCFASFFICSLFVIFSCAQAQEKTIQPASKTNQKTNWEVSPSLKFDTLCFLNILTGDPFYVRFYKEDYAKFEPQITPSARQALANLKRKIKDEKVETLTSYQFSSNKITAYVLRFPDPHGIRITGLRFIMSDTTSFKATVFIAIHELIHEPVRTLISKPDDLKIDAELQKVFEPLRNDEFLMNKVNNHNPSLGYNTFEGLINEDTTQALDQIIGEKLGVEREEAHKRWKEFDEGIHVFAVALYSLMKEEKFPQQGETLRNFLLRMIKTEKIGPGKIKPLYDTFYADYQKK